MPLTMRDALELIASAAFGSMTYIAEAVLIVFYVVVVITVVGAVLLARKIGKK